MKIALGIVGMLVSMWLTDQTAPRYLKELRAEHRLICRDAFRILVAVEVVGAVAFGALIGWAFFGDSWPGCLRLGGSLVMWSGFMDAVRLTDMGWYAKRRVARAHRDHDEDCEFGPRRPPLGLRVRLRPWRKVALNPAFAPA